MVEENRTSVTVKVSSHVIDSDKLESIFKLIIEDYADLFELTLNPKHRIAIALCDYTHFEGHSEEGMTVHTEYEDGTISLFVQVRDRSFEGDSLMYEDSRYRQMLTICHEAVHCAQWLTNSLGVSIYSLKNRTGDLERYLFEPTEVEARMLADYYVLKYCEELL